LCKGRNGYRKNKKVSIFYLVIANDFAPEANLKETTQKLLQQAIALSKSQVFYFFVQRQLFAEQQFSQVQGTLRRTLNNIRNN
jgi:hypothetical protein